MCTQDTELGNSRYKLLQISWYAERDKSMKFTSLAHLLDEEFLSDCYFSLNRNKAIGIDNISWEEYGKDLDNNLENLVIKLKQKKFKPQPAKRVYIPKGKGKTRPLGISSIENKIVERGITEILTAIYEQDFIDNSYGFRPRKNTHQALRKVNDSLSFKSINHIVEADIKGFFDNVSHDLLLNFLKVRISDSSLLFLINRFLKAGYVEGNLLVMSDKGTPQGSILSPILANIFLHYVLDEWFEKVVKAHTKGYCELIRYADDFVCLVSLKSNAKRIEKALKSRFNKYELELHPEKSSNLSFGRYEQENARNQKRKANTFTFLGFTHYCDVTRKGYFKVGRKTSKKKFASKCVDMNTWLKSIRNLVKTRDWWKVLDSKLRGHYQYYGVSENYKGLERYYNNTIKLVYKWLNRQSQKNRMNWIEFNSYLKHYPLSKPRIVHNFYISDAR